MTVGQELIDIVSLDAVWITANFKQSQLVHLRPGQPVEITVDAYGRPWRGHVTNLGGGASSANATPAEDGISNGLKLTPRVPVRIDFDRTESQAFNAEDMLKPGLSVEPKVRVRWLPRTRQLNGVSVGRGPLASPTASSLLVFKVVLRHRREPPPTSETATTTLTSWQACQTR